MSDTVDQLIAKKKQETAAAAQNTQAVTEARAKAPEWTSWWSTHDAMTISASVLLFGLVLIAYAARAVRLGTQPAVVLRLFGMLTIIIMAVFLVVAGYDANQISPVIGLLGTLAGYLAGRNSTPAGSNTDQAPPTDTRAKAPTDPTTAT